MSNPLKLFTFDLETLINCFLFIGKFYDDPKIYVFEISSRKNQQQELLNFLNFLQNSQVHMMGFNNIGFDNPIVQDLLVNPYMFGFDKAYQLCQQIIKSQGFGGQRFGHIPLSERILPQIDLLKLNHFDNANKSTSLKALQFAMRLPSIEDLPVPLGVALTSEQMDQAISYGIHDVTSTEEFGRRCMKHILIRKELLDDGVLSGDVLNYSDVKLGTEYLVKKIGRSKCYVKGSTPKQTLRESVAFKDIILPKIKYRTEKFNEVLEWFKAQVIFPQSDKEPPKLEARLANLDFYFGVGGVHASVDNRLYESTSTHVIRDIDVSGMYPAVAIANGFAPEHLGQNFVMAYRQLQIDRSQYKKGTTMNLILKLASNGAFGNGDNPYSCFYDPKFPKEITVNGQLQLLQLAEVLSLIPDLEIIQANTDGITAFVPRRMGYLFDLWKADWEKNTGLKLEESEYSRMWIRDVNNYLAIDTGGNIKAKGAYWYPKNPEDYWGGSGSVWHKDFSSMVVQKVTEKALIENWNPAALVYLMTDPFDFMIRHKTTKGSTVSIGTEQMPKTIRYYVSKTGGSIIKRSNPTGEIGTYKRKRSLTDEYYNKIAQEIPADTWDARIHTANKSKYEIVESNLIVGRLVKCCNVASDFSWHDVDYEYYIKEIEKLMIGDRK